MMHPQDKVRISRSQAPDVVPWVAHAQSGDRFLEVLARIGVHVNTMVRSGEGDKEGTRIGHVIYGGAGIFFLDAILAEQRF